MTKNEATDQLKSLLDHCKTMRESGEIWARDCEALRIAIADRRGPTREQVEALRGDWIDKPTGRYGQWQTWCSACGKHSGIGGIKNNRHRNFCPNCGCPQTDEAVEITLRRLEALHENNR